ncbi:carboxypeptidase regulatory-like domain-containing protein [Candidatus Woesearchaeota archaeon]|nr:carboxypeptidase regulatory-like domain-containing protein [Candidatus Woesearchaeota archaeon]
MRKQNSYGIFVIAALTLAVFYFISGSNTGMVSDDLDELGDIEDINLNSVIQSSAGSGVTTGSTSSDSTSSDTTVTDTTTSVEQSHDESSSESTSSDTTVTTRDSIQPGDNVVVLSDSNDELGEVEELELVDVANESEESDVYTILIKGRLVDQLTGEPIAGAQLMSAYNFSPSEVVSDENGNFQFSVSSDFKLSEGHTSREDNTGGSWSFFRGCYDYAYITLGKNFNGFSMALRETRFDALPEEVVTNVSGQNIVDVGELTMYPMADISIDSDIASSINVFFKYKFREGYNGGGQSGYPKEHYLSIALPLDYEVFIQFGDEFGNTYNSSVYRTPLAAKCRAVRLGYFNGESKWSVISNEPEKPFPEHFKVRLFNGWNLVPGLIDPLNQGMKGDLLVEDIKVIYGLLPSQDYVRVWPQPERDELDDMSDEEVREFVSTGTWVYAAKSGTIDYGPLFGSDLVAYDKIRLYKGWNFLSRERMLSSVLSSGVSLRGISGNCRIRRAYFFDSQAYQYVRIPLDGFIEVPPVILLKVSNNCQLGEVIAPPPELPGMPS